MKFPVRSAIGIAIVALGFAPGAWAQGCVLCYTSLANSGPAAMRAFEMAMFALLIPALLLFGGVFLLILRRAQTKDSVPSFSIRRKLIPGWLSS
jgi:hypothetical protein